jgi:hypothetical protein
MNVENSKWRKNRGNGCAGDEEMRKAKKREIEK